MATHSNVLAWRIPGTGEPGGLPSIRSHRVGHDWSNLAAAAAAAAAVFRNVEEFFIATMARGATYISSKIFFPLSIMFVNFISVNACSLVYVFSLLCSLLVHCLITPQFSCPFFFWWTFSVFPILCIYIPCTYEYSWTYLLKHICKNFPRIHFGGINYAHHKL